uniref:Uncharacterized protein n=1 Tax=Staphylococcus haemolyticus TaxID=1283 RepID=A0A1B1UYA0_STAHA|nr:hypothetical protein [Staphylococcus haemolyticus]
MSILWNGVVIEITKATNNKLYQAPQLDRAFCIYYKLL